MQLLKNRRRLRRLVRILIVLDLLAIMAVLGNRFITRWHGEAERDALATALDATDPGWRLGDVLAAREASFPPDEENIIIIAVKALPASFPAYLPWELHSEEWFHRTEQNRKPKPEEFIKAKRVRDDCAPVINDLRKIRLLKNGGYRPATTAEAFSAMMEAFGPIRKAVGILEMDALVACQEHDPERAFTSHQAALALARGLNNDPFYISVLLRYGISGDVITNLQRILAHTDSEIGLAGLQADLLTEARVEMEPIYCRGERAYQYYLLEKADHIDEGTDVRAHYADWQVRSRLPAAQAAVLRFQTDMLVNSSKPITQRLAGYKTIGSQIDDYISEHKGSPFNDFITGVHHMADIDNLSKSRMYKAATAIACERYRKQTGHWPNNLQDIPSSILSSIPDDCVTGLPLRCAKTSFGVIICATEIGEKGPPDYSKPGAALPKESFRLWDVTQRSQSP
ncbi:hypothetical protein BH11PLA2_BH11PLA2_07650 [soil metagenome]